MESQKFMDLFSQYTAVFENHYSELDSDQFMLLYVLMLMPMFEMRAFTVMCCSRVTSDCNCK